MVQAATHPNCSHPLSTVDNSALGNRKSFPSQALCGAGSLRQWRTETAGCVLCSLREGRDGVSQSPGLCLKELGCFPGVLPQIAVILNPGFNLIPPFFGHPDSASHGVMKVWKRDLKEDETVATAHVDSICWRCSPGYVGDTCQFPDPCTPLLCQNGGSCSSRALPPSTAPEYVCVCPPGFTGEKCQGVVGDPCFPSPCQHGGTCQRISGKEHQCQCLPGWTGKNCQLMDFCPANPCANGGTCVITYPFIVCQCWPGFEGHTCQQDINECFASPSPCLNGGSCINSIGSFRCLCPSNYSGPLCQYRWGPCSSEICLHGGTCHHVDGGYHGCLCLPGNYGYTGQYCEVNPDDCAGHQCLNGGTCQDGIGSYTCHCIRGWTGETQARNKEANLRSNPCHPDAHCDTDLQTGHAICTCQLGYAGAVCYEDIDECQMGFEGLRCERDADFCRGAPCEHGTCVNVPGSFTCVCAPGFTGPLCKEFTDPCRAFQCLNGGSCHGTESGS
ncbi:Neurogenic locus notch-like protein 4, partial [Ophiophagus hannah]